MTNKIDPKYIDVPNICFSLTEKTDDREEEFSKQRIDHGFDESETWSLDHTIARFILPRIKEFWRIEQKVTMMKSQEELEYKESMPKIIRAFELIVRDNDSRIWNEQEEKEYEEGIDLFAKYLLWMWW